MKLPRLLKGSLEVTAGLCILGVGAYIGLSIATFGVFTLVTLSAAAIIAACLTIGGAIEISQCAEKNKKNFSNDNDSDDFLEKRIKNIREKQKSEKKEQDIYRSPILRDPERGFLSKIKRSKSENSKPTSQSAPNSPMMP